MMRSAAFSILFFFLTATFTAQTFNFKRFSEENGLPQNFIYSISQGPGRKLFCSTGEGICIYNGITFNTITNKRLAENFVTTHFVDSRGIIWMGHNQNGVSYIRNGNITELNSGDLKNFKVLMMIEDHRGNLFVATAGGGIFVVDSVFRVFHVAGSPEVTQSIVIPYTGCLLAATNDGLRLLYLSADGRSVSKEGGELLREKNVRQIVPVNSQGVLFWALCDENEVFGIKFSGDAPSLFRKLERHIPAGNFINCIYSDRDENLFLGTLGDGLRKFIFEGSVLSSKYSSLKMNRQGGFGSHHVQSIFQDIEGNMWFGTLADGLFQRPLEKFAFYSSGEGLKELQVAEVVSHAGRLWLGGDSGVSVYNSQSRSHRRLAFPHNKKDRVTSMCFDSTGKIWVGTANSGLFLLDTVSLKFDEYSVRHNLSKLNINCVSPYQSKMAVGTTEGLYILNTKTGECETLNTNEGLLHNNVLSTFCDSKGRLWIASHGAPPYFVDQGKVTAFKKINGLNSYRINSYCEDKNGTIWIATEGDGVFSYGNNSFRNYPTNMGLLSDYCNGIICGADNSIWVTHRAGLSEKKAGNQVFSNFTEQKGLAFVENSLNALCVDGEEIWFGTSQGVVNYKLSRISSDVRPEVHLTSIKFNNKLFPPGRLPDQSYGYYSVQFDFLAVMLAEPNAVLYNYRMLGIDTTWRVTQSRTVDFPKLSDGSYTFQLSACNKNTGLCGTEIIEEAFVIDPPVWKRFWFYLLLLVAIVGSTSAIVVVRTRALKRTQLLLQLKVKQKTFLLQREKEAVETIKIELEHRNKDITDSINYAKRIQDSILPPDELLKDIFGDNYFVLFKPKDIVSGDFYWAAKMRANSGNKEPILAAVVDCTGHGVPGAFLSIMANDFLRQSIVDPKVTAPNQVLDFLNEHVSSHLNQSASKNIMRDGMDIAIIEIDLEKRKLYFSGANNPIYIFREVNGMIDQIILTATKQSIGLISEETVKYSFREFNLVKGDTVYLFSDGYADQFGGENNKKLTYKKFRELLAATFYMPMQEQKAFLEKAFDDWCADTDQIDDVTVMGIRIV